MTNCELSQAAEHTPDQGLRNGETPPDEKRHISKPRRIAWRIPAPSFQVARELAPYDLALHAEGQPPRGRVFVVGQAMTKGELQRVGTTAPRQYAEGRYPTVTTGNGTQVAYAAQWFGEQPYTTQDCAAVWNWLQVQLQTQWRDDGIALLMTPATTGRDLWVRSIRAEGWPVMSQAAQAAVRPTGGQGRMEVLNAAPGRTLGVLYEYDARMAYVSLMRELPVGEPELLNAGEAARFQASHPYSEGRYAVSWKAPRGWTQPGILAAHGDGPTQWVWPLQGDGWAGGAELHTALEAGWTVELRDGCLVWPTRGKPLERWRDALLRVLALSDELAGPQPAMVRSAIRAMMLHAVGAFHGAPHQVAHQGPPEAVPGNARRLQVMRDGWYSWVTDEPARWPQLVHPEWSVTIWGRARARLASGHRGRTGFLTADPASLVAFRTDAVYTTRATGWDAIDDGQPGRYRCTRMTFDDAQPWPTNGPELLRLRASCQLAPAETIASTEGE